MECYCGCGRRVSRRLTDTNLRISEVALELLAWDKRRAMSAMDPGDFVETERLINRGANSHRAAAVRSRFNRMFAAIVWCFRLGARGHAYALVGF